VGAAGRARISYAIGMAKPICGGCRERDARIAALERRVADLEARLGQNSSNWPLPSSANPLAAPKPVVKAPTGRKGGSRYEIQ